MELTRREQNKLQSRTQILKASRRLFSGKGYEQTTMEDVAARAGVSKATLYNYFSSKESLLLGIAEAELAEIDILIGRDLAEEPSAVKKLRRVLQHFVLDAMAYIPLARKITCLNSCEQSELYHTRVQMLDIFAKLAAEGQEKGELRRDVPVSDIVDLLMGIYFVSQFQWPGIDTYTTSHCIARLNHFFDCTLAGVLL